jgi:hypothetical protein
MRAGFKSHPHGSHVALGVHRSSLIVQRCHFLGGEGGI